MWNPISRSSASPKSYSLDGLRAVAALAVVALHADPLAAVLGIDIPWADVGATGVQLFFVLSGYLITTSVLSRSYSPRTYVVNRVFRILPAYFASLLLVLFVLNANPLTTLTGVKDVTSHAFLVHGVFRDYRVSLNPVLWTLSVEWFFYLFMLLVARGVRHPRGGWWVAGGMLAVALAYKTWMWHAFDRPNDLAFYYKQLPGTADQFACGMLVALGLQQPAFDRFTRRRDVRAGGFAIAAAALAVALVLYHRNPGERPTSYWFDWKMVILWPLLFCGASALLLLCLRQSEERVGPWIRRSGLAFVGLISYSLYLLHPLVLRAFRRGWDPDIATVPEAGYLVAAIASVLGVAALSYLLVERPFMDVRRRFTRPAARAALGARSPDPPRPALVDALAEP